ncbi:hypothetical protein RM780_24185 [Streptomyces sp. DSM 44917]|uniref:Uncharacterized protein n=1 Tax=Streptomyces boetiae TaxID=3075541 RepID=A0ABU2LEN3_9ACTN|nr:hypothetical protein [Streptomyces sp. DSM 44917]
MQEQEPPGDNTPTVKAVDNARSEARDLSSRLYEWTGIEGRTTEPGPVVSNCESDAHDETLYVMRHPWTIYDTAAETLERGFNNLRDRMEQEDGWELRVDEVENNQDQTPHLLFVNRDLEYAVDVWLTGRNGDNPQLEIWTQSACFRTPDGETRNGS